MIALLERRWWNHRLLCKLIQGKLFGKQYNVCYAEEVSSKTNSIESIFYKILRFEELERY